MRFKEACLLVLMTAAPLSADIFSVSDFFNSDLNSVNTTTGASTLIGDAGSGSDEYNSLAVNTAGEIFSVGDVAFQSDRLTQFNTTTGLATSIATVDLGSVDVDVRGLAFSSSDVLYAANIAVNPDTSVSSSIYTINTSTGVGTLVGDTGLGLQCLSFAQDGNLYSWDAGLFSNDDGLIRIDTTDGSVTDVSAANGNFGVLLQGLALGQDGKFYGASQTQLYEINILDGTLNAIGSSTLTDVRGIAGVVPVPEPSTLILMSLTLVVGIILARRVSAAEGQVCSC